MTHRLPLKQKVFYVDSMASPADSKSTIDMVLKVPKHNEFNRMSVSQCEVPHSYYNFDNDVTTRTFGLTDGDVTAVGVTFINGLYTASQFAEELEDALNDASTENYTVILNTITGKFEITNDTSDFGFIFTSDNVLLQQYLGFDVGAGSVNSTTRVLVSDNIIDVHRYCHLMVHCNIAENNDDDVVAHLLPCHSDPAEIIQYKTVDFIGNSISLQNTRTNRIKFTLTDSNNNLIDLQKKDWRLVFTMWKDEGNTY